MSEFESSRKQSEVLCERIFDSLIKFRRNDFSALELRSLWPHCTRVHCRTKCRFLCYSTPTAWPFFEHFDNPTGQVFPVRRSQPHVEASCSYRRLASLLHASFSRDCLAAPGTTVSEQVVVQNGLGAGNPNKNKICYKCQQEGHVRDHYPHGNDCPHSLASQIARDCPQTAEFAA